MPIFTALIRGGMAVLTNISRGVMGGVIRYAQGMASQAGMSALKYVSSSMPSLIQKGAELLRKMSNPSQIFSVREKMMNSKVKLNVTSFSSITGASVESKIQNYISNRVAGIRATNPSANIKTSKRKKYTSAKISSGIGGKGFDDFADALDAMSDNVETIISIEGSASAETMKRKLMVYPPERNNSLYTRTFDLQHGWEVSFVSFNINDTFAGDMMSPPSQNATSVSFSNAVPYSKWVQRRTTQSWVHRGRWNTVEDVAESESPEFQSRVEQAINNILS